MPRSSAIERPLRPSLRRPRDLAWAFLAGLAIACTPGGEGDAPQWASATDPARTLIGYASEITVRPGETVDFMVSAIEGGSYEADLVKVVNGDAQSRYGHMFEVRPVEAPFAGTYEGIEQSLDLGSYVHVEDPGSLDGLGSFTVAAWIFPTFDPTEYEPPDLENPDPFSPPTLSIAPLILDDGQTVVSRFDQITGTGWALGLDEEFRLEFVAGDGGATSKVHLDQPVRDWDWAHVSASYDAGSGSVSLRLHEKPYAPGDRLTARNLETTGEVGAVVQRGPLRIAAVRDGPGAARARFEKPGSVFNGRIQDVRIADRVLAAQEIDALSSETVPPTLSGADLPPINETSHRVRISAG
jgi:N,N-dimethylformamidase